MKPLLPVIMLISFVFGSCQKEDKKAASTSGYFRLTEIRTAGIKSTQNIASDSVKNVFDLGDLKNSKDFYFILSNGGEKPIFDIALATDNRQIGVSPANISVIPGTESAGSNDIIPLIALEAVHGTQLNGVGYTGLLPMGENRVKLSVTGKTLDGNDTLNLSSEFFFNLAAKVMDISLVYDGKEIDLVNPIGAFTGVINPGIIDFIPNYLLFTDSVRIQNIGNVDINLTVVERVDSLDYNTESDIIPLPVNQSLQIHLTHYLTILILNSNGTITDASRIRLGNDGNGYISIEKREE
jgi:hypothetical protein